MSRMGQKPIIIPENTELEIKDSNILVCKGKQGQIQFQIHPTIKIEKNNNQLILRRKSNDQSSKSIHGVSRKIVLNALSGVNNLFEKKLEVNGVGYRVKLDGNELELMLGYSHPVKIIAPEGIDFKVKKNLITVMGIDKQLVGQVAAQIRNMRKPEPYKGKGIKYSDEIITKKAGKALKAQTETK